jgi:FkbM family methyltransferase
MIPNLIFDVGMNNGDDTAYYLHKGYRVIAVEADPTLVDKARDRFAAEVRDGQLELVNVAIGSERGIAPFWICDVQSEWNSFDRALASRLGFPHHAIDVRCCPFRDMLDQYGVPSYLKVDIEGHDHYCLADLRPEDLPSYVSFEMTQIEMLFSLRNLGYSGFKLITQNNHSQLVVDLFSVKALLKRRLGPHSTVGRLARWASRVRRQIAVARPVPNDRPAWQFNWGSSGPFGEDTPGRWQSFDEAVYTWVTYQLGGSRYGTPSLEVWHDVHATRLVSPPPLLS